RPAPTRRAHPVARRDPIELDIRAGRAIGVGNAFPFARPVEGVRPFGAGAAGEGFASLGGTARTRQAGEAPGLTDAGDAEVTPCAAVSVAAWNRVDRLARSVRRATRADRTGLAVERAFAARRVAAHAIDAVAARALRCERACGPELPVVADDARAHALGVQGLLGDVPLIDEQQLGAGSN